MLTLKEINKLTKLRVYDKTRNSYVHNLIIKRALQGYTHLKVESVFIQPLEIKELTKLGYTVKEISDDRYNIKWNN